MKIIKIYKILSNSNYYSNILVNVIQIYKLKLIIIIYIHIHSNNNNNNIYHSISISLENALHIYTIYITLISFYNHIKILILIRSKTHYVMPPPHIHSIKIFLHSLIMKLKPLMNPHNPIQAKDPNLLIHTPQHHVIIYTKNKKYINDTHQPCQSLKLISIIISI